MIGPDALTATTCVTACVALDANERAPSAGLTAIVCAAQDVTIANVHAMSESIRCGTRLVSVLRMLIGLSQAASRRLIIRRHNVRTDVDHIDWSAKVSVEAVVRNGEMIQWGHRSSAPDT